MLMNMIFFLQAEASELMHSETVGLTPRLDYLAAAVRNWTR